MTALPLPPLNIANPSNAISGAPLSLRDLNIQLGHVNFAQDGGSIDNAPNPRDLNSPLSFGGGDNMNDIILLGAAGIALFIVLKKKGG